MKQIPVRQKDFEEWKKQNKNSKIYIETNREIKKCIGVEFTNSIFDYRVILENGDKPYLFLEVLKWKNNEKSTP